MVKTRALGSVYDDDNNDEGIVAHVTWSAFSRVA